jgi:uncharacterized membrane protein (DUF373 family)
VTEETAGKGARNVVSNAFARLQDVVYVLLGVVLAISALAVLVHGGIELAQAVVHGELALIVALLDRTLLALMIVELLYTVQVSFREHTLVPEPFVLVALIAAVRRVLIITAEFGAQTRPEEHLLRLMMWELALLAALIVVFVGSLAILRRGEQVAAKGHDREGGGVMPNGASPAPPRDDPA